MGYLVEAGLRETPPTAADHHAGQEERTEREWLKGQLVRVGNNLNQVVRALHSQTGSFSHTRLNQTLDELTAILKRIAADLIKSKE